MRYPDGRKRILVTGGAGFIGPHLCERLLADRNAVLCVDNRTPCDFSRAEKGGLRHK